MTKPLVLYCSTSESARNDIISIRSLLCALGFEVTVSEISIAHDSLAFILNPSGTCTIVSANYISVEATYLSSGDRIREILYRAYDELQRIEERVEVNPDAEPNPVPWGMPEVQRGDGRREVPINFSARPWSNGGVSQEQVQTTNAAELELRFGVSQRLQQRGAGNVIRGHTGTVNIDDDF